MAVADELQELLDADHKRSFLTRKQRQAVRKAIRQAEHQEKLISSLHRSVDSLNEHLKEINKKYEEAQSAADFFEGEADLYRGMSGEG